MDTKISDLPLKSVPAPADVLPIVDSVGTITKKISVKSVWDAGDSRYISPSFTYNPNGSLAQIIYADTSYKTFTYTSDKLTQIDFYVVGSPSIIRKTLTYSGDTLLSITQTIV